MGAALCQRAIQNLERRIINYQIIKFNELRIKEETQTDGLNAKQKNALGQNCLSTHNILDTCL